MKIYLVNFATSNFYGSQKRLNKSAQKFGVDHCLSFTSKDIINTEFYRNNEDILNQPRGAGYWLWKPYIILEAFRQADEGDIIIYSDSGAEIIQDLQPLIDICLKKEGLVFFRVPNITGQHINIEWTKRDCFVLMDADRKEFHLAQQVAGSPQFYVKNKRNIEFVEEWLSYCEDPRILTDMPNTLGHRNYPQFIDHRHDQSVLSILALRHNLELFRDPSQFADHLKIEPFRKQGELPPGVNYSPTPDTNSPYGTLFNLHRERNFSISHKLSKTVSKMKQKKDHTRMVTQRSKPKISIGITTFENRFEKYFVPLLSKIKEYVSDAEIIVAINGEHNQPFNQDYRKEILLYLSSMDNVFPIMFPQFRGVSKLWNSIIIHATHDHILMLNDDIMITSNNFLQEIEKLILQNNGNSFTINDSWSHFVISRDEIDHIGYFDERLLGIGEEDGDFSWRYFHEYRRLLANFKVRCFKNYAEDTVYTYKPTNIKCHSGTKYSLFNKNFINQKYKEDPYGFTAGMFEKPVRLKDAGPEQYPTEKFYRKKKNDL